MKRDKLIFDFISTELAEAAEFEIYEKYADDITSVQSKDALQKLLSRPEVCIFLCNHFNKKKINFINFYSFDFYRQVNYLRPDMVLLKLSNIIYQNYY